MRSKIGWLASAVWLAFSLSNPLTGLGKDYILTIGGGYNPRGNQASLEANVLFFEEVLLEKHTTEWDATVYFADGDDKAADLQFIEPNSAQPGPLTDFLGQLHSRGRSGQLGYRNHQVQNAAGSLSPKNVESYLRTTAAKIQPSDRLIVYVTAHGEAAKGDNAYNTYISCWNGKRFSAEQFARWLDEFPPDVPVILVMAQCYCGGFANTIFEKLDQSARLSNHLRCGFFAQQHDLAAAGCRPDIKNDEEYSSFFWGAFAGRSRNGRPLPMVDANDDGQISFAEAHAEAVIVSQTIDIPLRTSEVLLRRYSRIPDYQHHGLREQDKELITNLGPSAREPSQSSDATAAAGLNEFPSNASNNSSSDVLTASSQEAAPEHLLAMQGNLSELLARTSPENARIIRELSAELNLEIGGPVTNVFEAYQRSEDALRSARRRSSRGRRGRSSGRRELRQEIAEQWPELADSSDWRSSDLLASDQQVAIFAEIQSLPSYDRVATTAQERQQVADRIRQAELTSVKCQRLIHTLELIVLAENLPAVASPDVLERYRKMLAIEMSTL